MAQTAKSSGKELDALDIFRKTVLKPKRGGPPATKRMHEEGKARRDMNASRTHMRHAGRPPFSPANPYAAKEAVARKMDERFVSQGTPYDTAHDQVCAARMLSDAESDSRRQAFWSPREAPSAGPPTALPPLWRSTWQT